MDSENVNLQPSGGARMVDAFIAADFSDDDVVFYVSVRTEKPDNEVHLLSRGQDIWSFESCPSNLGISDTDSNDAVFRFQFSSV